jgi:aryl-alcohol dehydrogenase-like predicted oxidoreductase
MAKSIKLTTDGNEYTAELNNNRTTEDIIKMMPLELIMKTRKLGTNGLEVSAIGLGCMEMHHAYGPPAEKRVMIQLIKEAATGKNATPAQISLAWVLAQKPWIVPIPGTTKLHRLIENLGAANVELTLGELQEINTASSEIKVQGDRYSGDSAKLINR